MNKQVTKSLSEQLQISEAEIAARKELFGINDQIIQQLTKYKFAIRSELTNIVDEFYAAQTARDETSLLIGDIETLERLKQAQKHYLLSLFSCQYDLSYINHRLRIGLVHKRIGVPPKLYLSAVQDLKEIVIKRLKKHHISSAEEENKLRIAFSAILQFDISYVFDTYIESMLKEIELSKRSVEEYAKTLEDKINQRTEKLKEMTFKDELTDLYNKRAFADLAPKTLSFVKRQKQFMTILFMDLDYFKDINDHHGHAHGDHCLKLFAESILSTCRSTDIPFRFGGDEFCILLPNCTNEEAISIAEKIDNKLKPLKENISFSFGVCQTGKNRYLSIDELVTKADMEMYKNKKKNSSST